MKKEELKETWKDRLDEIVTFHPEGVVSCKAVDLYYYIKDEFNYLWGDICGLLRDDEGIMIYGDLEEKIDKVFDKRMEL